MDKYDIACNVTHDTCNDTRHTGTENKSKTRRLTNHITNITEIRTTRKLGYTFCESHFELHAQYTVT
jgi:hypothetical protein